MICLVGGILACAVARPGLAQAPADTPASNLVAPGPSVAPGDASASPAADKVLELCLAEIENLHAQEAALQAKPQDEELKKKIDILEKQIETLEKLVKLLAEQIKKQ